MTTSNPYRLRFTLFGLLLNAAFFLFLGVFLSPLFQMTSSGIQFVRPTDFTSLWLLPVFAASTMYLGVGIVDQIHNRQRNEVYFWPIFFFSVLQFLASIFVILFLLDVAFCLTSHFLWFKVC